MKVSFHPDIVPSGWLGSKYQLTNELTQLAHHIVQTAQPLSSNTTKESENTLLLQDVKYSTTPFN